MSRPGSWLGPVLLVLGLAPALAVGLQAVDAQDSQAAGVRKTKRQLVLEQIPKDASVLINVKQRDMPASPDILNLGKRSTKALERCLSDNVDPGNRSSCAIVLEALADRRALPTLHSALDDWEAEVRHKVVNALAAIPDKSSVKPLLKIYQRKDEEQYVRTAALRALGAISDQAVVRALRNDLRRKPKKSDDGPDMRPLVFDALWSNRHLMGRATLIGDTRAALKSDNDNLVHSATLAATELRSPRLVPALIPLMEHQWPEVRNKAVYALGKIGDRQATKALLKKLPDVRESRMLNNIAFALERLDKKAFYASIKSIVEHKQAIIRLNAAFVLGDVRHAEGLSMLEKALADANDYVRTSAIVAVGKLVATSDEQTARAVAALQPFVKQGNLTVRQEAIYAMHALSQGGRKDLIHDELFAKLNSTPQLQRKHGAIIRRAAIKLGELNDTRVRSYLLSCYLSHGCRQSSVARFLRAHADRQVKGRLLLGWARRDTGLSSLVAALKPAGLLPIATSVLEEDWARPQWATTQASLRVLGSLGDNSVAPLLTKRSNTTATMARINSLVALARLGDGSAGSKLMAELDNMPAEYLPRLVWSLSTIEEPAARGKLQAELQAKSAASDPHVAMAASAIILGWEPDKGIYRFRQALASNSGFERDLAERYLMRNKQRKVTWLLRRTLAREGAEDTRDRIRAVLDSRN